MAHQLNNHDPFMRVCSRMQPVDRFRGNVHSRVETESSVGPPYIIVDCFGDTDHIKAFLRQKVCGFDRPVPTYANEAVEAHLLVMLPDENRFLNLIFLSCALKWFFPRCAKYCSSQGENAREILLGKLPVL